MENTNKVLLGVLGGIAVGALAGVLFAPKSGSETREDIVKAIEELKAKVASLIEKGEDIASENVANILSKISELETKLSNNK